MTTTNGFFSSPTCTFTLPATLNVPASPGFFFVTTDEREEFLAFSFGNRWYYADGYPMSGVTVIAAEVAGESSVNAGHRAQVIRNLRISKTPTALLPRIPGSRELARMRYV